MQASLSAVALFTGICGMIGAAANAVATVIHCRRDKKHFEELKR